MNANEVSSMILQLINEYDKQTKLEDEGNVLSVGDGIALIYGIQNVMYNELIHFVDADVYGLALNLDKDVVGVIIIGSDVNILENSIVKRTKKLLKVGVGDNFLGHVVNGFGEVIDGSKNIKCDQYNLIDNSAPGVMMRESVSEPLETGIISIDAMIPIGKGQRELIIGDRQTGKTAIAIDTIINLKHKDVICIYVAIGQKNSTVTLIHEALKKNGALKNTLIVSATASEAPAYKYLSPYVGCAFAEYWMNKGKDVLIVYDDLSKHAVSYRTISLLLRKPPGREAYPGDIFYLHSRLLERSAKLSKEHGGGSITALPIIETQAGDISAYIPTNVISITDGQIFLENDLFNSGQRPAINVGLSVSRVGSAAQIKTMKDVSTTLKLQLAQYTELKAFSQFGSDLDKETILILDRGKKISEVLKQPQYQPMSQSIQAVVLFAIKINLIKYIPLKLIQKFKFHINTFLTNTKNKYFLDMQKNKKWTDENKEGITKLLKQEIYNFLVKIDYEYAKDSKIKKLNQK